MGCGSSKPSKASNQRQARPRPAAISAPTGGPSMVPPIYRDSQGRPVQHSSFTLTRDTIHQALDSMAAYLSQQNVTANVVTVGGAVNTLYLQSRESTHDVDFFLGDPSAPIHQAIHQAARHANRQMGGTLGGEWFNNTTQIMMGRQVQQHIATVAFEQNTIVYQRIERGGGLRIYAAPWSYAFCGKLNRLCNDDPRPYDMADAVAYLYEYLRTHRKNTISKRSIFAWGQQFGKNVTEEVLQQVNEAYYEKYRQRPIVG